MVDFLVILLLVLFNGFFALSEMAVITSRKGRLKEMAKDSRGARKALHLSEHPEAFLSAVQVWITLISLVTGYVGGDKLGSLLVAPLREHVPVLAPYAVSISTVFGTMWYTSVT